MPTVEANGAELHYDERGSGSPVLLVHGTAACVWGDTFDRLATSHRVIAYDRRSFGGSAQPPPEDPRVHARDAAALLEALAAAPATIVGWSLGGVVAIELALERPDLVRALVLLEPALHVKSRPSLPELITIIRIQLARRRDERRAADIFLRWALGDRSGGGGFERLKLEYREQMLANAHAILADIDGGTGEHVKRRDLAAIVFPVVVLTGDRSDRTFARAARRIKGALPRVEHRVIAGAGHILQLDAPEEVAAAVEELAG